MPFKGRFWFDYYLFELFNRLGYVKVVKTIFILVILQFYIYSLPSDNQLVSILMFLLLVIPSPLFVKSIFSYGKPESIAWIIYPYLLFNLFNNNLISVSIGSALLASLNVTVSLLFSSIFCVVLIFNNLWFDGIFYLLPSFIILSLRLYRYSNVFGLQWVFKNISNKPPDQNISSSSKNTYGIYNLVFMVLIFSVTSLHSIIYGEFLIFISGVLLVLSHLFNSVLFRFSDTETFYRFWCLSLVILNILFPNTISLFLYLIIFYLFLPYSLVVEKEREIFPSNEFPNISFVDLKDLRDYTFSSFNQFSFNDRIALEVSSTDKFLNGFRMILGFWEYCLNPKGVEFIPSEWMRSTSPKYLANHYSKMRDSREKIKQISEDLGIKYFLSYSPKFSEMLDSLKFQYVGTYEANNWKEYGGRKIFTSDYDLKIYKVVGCRNSLIEPNTEFVKKDGKIIFTAEKHQTYIIKYIYYDYLESINDLNIFPIIQNDLKFIGIRSELGGKIEIKF